MLYLRISSLLSTVQFLPQIFLTRLLVVLQTPKAQLTGHTLSVPHASNSSNYVVLVPKTWNILLPKIPALKWTATAKMDGVPGKSGKRHVRFTVSPAWISCRMRRSRRTGGTSLVLPRESRRTRNPAQATSTTPTPAMAIVNLLAPNPPLCTLPHQAPPPSILSLLCRYITIVAVHRRCP
jgi:hypothetical protein